MDIKNSTLQNWKTTVLGFVVAVSSFLSTNPHKDIHENILYGARLTAFLGTVSFGVVSKDSGNSEK